MIFSLLHPTRSRPEKSFKAIQQWINHSITGDFEVIVSIDSNDSSKDQYYAQYGNYGNIKVIENDNRSAVDAINNAAKASQGEVMIVVSDDTGCTNQWDKVIQDATRGHKDYVLKTFDGVQKWICTMPVIDRTYYNRFGYVYHPGYLHQFCDTEFTHVADVTKRMIWRNDIEIRHNHYSVLKQARDPLYTRNDNTWNQGKDLYLSRAKQDFGLTGINVFDLNGNAEFHLQWLKKSL